MSEIAEMKKQIVNYSKTREVYVAYRKAGYSKKFLAEHEREILLHKAAKKAFDELGLKKAPHRQEPTGRICGAAGSEKTGLF